MKQRGHRPDDMFICNATAHWLRTQRKAAGLTQKQLAEVMGIGCRTIEKMEAGNACIRRDVWLRILAYCAICGWGLAPRENED